MLLFVANPLAAKPAAPAFTTSGAINEAEFLVFDMSPQFLGQSVQAACNEAVATADLATVFPHDMSPAFIGMSAQAACNEAVTTSDLLSVFPHDMSPLFISAAAAIAEAVVVTNDCTSLYA